MLQLIVATICRLCVILHNSETGGHNLRGSKSSYKGKMVTELIWNKRSHHMVSTQKQKLQLLIPTSCKCNQRTLLHISIGHVKVLWMGFSSKCARMLQTKPAIATDSDQNLPKTCSNCAQVRLVVSRLASKYVPERKVSEAVISEVMCTKFGISDTCAKLHKVLYKYKSRHQLHFGEETLTKKTCVQII